MTNSVVRLQPMVYARQLVALEGSFAERLEELRTKIAEEKGSPVSEVQVDRSFLAFPQIRQEYEELMRGVPGWYDEALHTAA